MQIHARTYDKYLRYQILAVLFRGSEAAEEHRQLLDCALARDSQMAQRILSRHIAACVEHTLHNGLFPPRRSGAEPDTAPTS